MMTTNSQTSMKSSGCPITASRSKISLNNPNPLSVESIKGKSKNMKLNSANQLVLTAAMAFVFSMLPSHGAVSIFGSYVGFKINQSVSVSWYGAIEWGTDIQNLGSASLGTFNWSTNPDSLILDAFQVQTAKSGGGDITGANLYYRVYQQGQTPGDFNQSAAGFIANAPFTAAQGSSAGGGGDQNWGINSGLNANILSTINVTVPTVYNLEIYLEATSNEGTQFSNNGGANYIATFTAVPEPSSASLMGLGLAGLLALRRIRKA